MRPAPALVALTEGGAELGRRLAGALEGAELHGLAGRVERPDVAFDKVGEHLRALHAAGRPIIGLCASGILVRALAPMLADKSSEPPVLAVAEDGSAVVPLLGGHRGANALAEAMGAALGVAPAITTAGDRRFGVAFDDPPAGWRLANPGDYGTFAASLLAGERVCLEGDAPWLRNGDLPLHPEGPLRIVATDRAGTGDGRTLVYHPTRLALGVGCERDTDPGELMDLALGVLDGHGLASGAVAGVYSLNLKADEPAVHALADALGVPGRFFDAGRLEAEAPRLANPSEVVFREVGCHGVAEGAALAAAGPGAELIVEKTRSARATCAVARAVSPFDGARAGRAQGRLLVVGLGPGAPECCTPEVSAALDAAEDLVGYSLYLDLVSRPCPGARRHPFPLGAERERVEHALELAGQGRTVALVCSGDPGIYAMASLVMEILDGVGNAAVGRIRVEVLPGLSALQVAAARAGAPLGHDFCAVSLSDLLTPWPVIETRLRAAAQGDFVVALFNPVSRRRREQLPRALDLLAEHRPPDTPVVVARNLGREGERVRITTLADRDLEGADMLTVLLVGSSTTRAMKHRPELVYTPRGYDA